MTIEVTNFETIREVIHTEMSAICCRICFFQQR